jgi:hypothetical protein
MGGEPMVETIVGLYKDVEKGREEAWEEVRDAVRHTWHDLTKRE